MSRLGDYFTQQRSGGNTGSQSRLSSYFQSSGVVERVRADVAAQEQRKKVENFNRARAFAQQAEQDSIKATQKLDFWQGLIDIPTGVAKSVFGAAKEMATEKQKAYEQSISERGVVRTKIEQAKGMAKNIGELASGTAKLAVGLSPVSNFSTIRKVISNVGGKQVEEYLDRNTPEYQKKVGAWIDNSSILNYHPDYANEIQRTGGEVAEIGSWFIPITRAGKAEKLGELFKAIPKVKQLIGVTPKLVKVGPKYAFEVSKDVVDVATLDAIRGKDWETIQNDIKYAAAGGAALRGVAGGIGGILKMGKTNRLVNMVEQGVGKLDDEERAIATRLIDENRTADDIAEEIMNARQSAGKEVIGEPVEDLVTKFEKEAATETKVAEKVEVPTEKVETPIQGKSLQEGGKKLYRETSLEGLAEDFAGKNKYEPRNFHEDINLALGQGENKGVIIKMGKTPDIIANGKGSVGEKLVTNPNYKETVESVLVPRKLLSHPKERLKLRNAGFEIPATAKELNYVDAGITRKGEKYVELKNSNFSQPQGMTPKAKESVAPKTTVAKEAPVKKTESPILKRLNENLDEANKVDPNLDVTTHKEQLAKAEKIILEDPKKAYNDAVFGGKKEMSDPLRTSTLSMLLENAKVKGDQKAIAEIGTALAKHGRKSGQEVEMIKAMIKENPTNKALVDLAEAKLKSVAARFKKLKFIAKEGEDVSDAAVRIVKSKAKQILLKERKAKVEKARNLIKSLTC